MTSTLSWGSRAVWVKLVDSENLFMPKPSQAELNSQLPQNIHPLFYIILDIFPSQHHTTFLPCIAPATFQHLMEFVWCVLFMSICPHWNESSWKQGLYLFLLLTYHGHPEKCLAHKRYLINIYGINEWIYDFICPEIFGFLPTNPPP